LLLNELRLSVKDVIMDDASPSAIRTLRLLIGLSIVTAGAAVALALFYLWAIDAPLRPAVVLVATLGVGLTVLGFVDKG
jgi:ABC-type Mn2+/Zn2+ transport system permease subunit